MDSGHYMIHNDQEMGGINPSACEQPTKLNSSDRETSDGTCHVLSYFHANNRPCGNMRKNLIVSIICSPERDNRIILVLTRSIIYFVVDLSVFFFPSSGNKLTNLSRKIGSGNRSLMAIVPFLFTNYLTLNSLDVYIYWNIANRIKECLIQFRFFIFFPFLWMCILAFQRKPSTFCRQLINFFWLPY